MRKIELEKTLLRWWWVILFVLGCFAVWERERFASNQAIDALTEQESMISNQIQKAEALQADLKAQIAAKDDPAWIEQVLIERTGAIPSGTKKVIFSNHD